MLPQPVSASQSLGVALATQVQPLRMALASIGSPESCTQRRSDRLRQTEKQAVVPFSLHNPENNARHTCRIGFWEGHVLSFNTEAFDSGDRSRHEEQFLIHT